MSWVRLEVGVVQFFGSDRIAFLHGQCSNDIRGLAVGTACTALVLNAKGQVEFEVQILRRAEDVLVFCPLGLEQALFERFKRYIIFDDVQMQITKEYQLLHMVGDLETDNLHWEKSRGFAGGVDVLLPKDAPVPNSQPLEDVQLARIRAGIPSVHEDGFVGWLPQECGFEFAVSYKKGCYIGQEIMARLEARGQTRYELVRVRLAQPPTDTTIVQNNKEIGQLGMCVSDDAGFLALATVRRDRNPTEPILAAGIPITIA